MLPFLNKKAQTGLLVKERAPDQDKPQEESSELEQIASDLIKAVSAKDEKAVAMLLQEAHDCCSNPAPMSQDVEQEIE